MSHVTESEKEIKSDGIANMLSRKPTMPKLLNLVLLDGKAIDITDRIGTSYAKFGSLLLNDDEGNIVETIYHNNNHQAVPTNMEILNKWLQGRGKHPVTWETLINVVKVVRHELARQIVEALNVLSKKHDYSQIYD